MAELDLVVRARNEAKRALKDAEDDVRSLTRTVQSSDSAMGRLGTVMKTGLKVGAVALAGGVLTLGAAMTSTAVSGTMMAADLEAGMSSVASIMGETTDAVKPLKDLVLDLGMDPNLKVDADQAAEAIAMLARNGLSMDEVMQGAAHSTILLANATSADFGTAADIATDAMALFNIEAGDMNDAVNGITSVVNNSKFSIDDYRLAMAQTGGVAASVGVGFDDMNTSLAAIAPLFASGSDAGTSYKTMLQRLVPTTGPAKDAMKDLGLYTDEAGSAFFDAQGNMKSMADISSILNTATAGLSEEQKNLAFQTIFGTDAMRAAFGLAAAGEVAYTDAAKAAQELGVSQEDLTDYMADGLTAFEALQVQMGQTDALEAAKTRMDNLRGAMEILRGVVDTVKIRIGDVFVPVVRQAAEALTTFLVNNQDTIVGFFQAIVDKAPVAATAAQDLWTAAAWIWSGEGAEVDWWWDITDAINELTGGMLGTQEQADALASTLYDLGVKVSDAIQPIKDFAAEWLSWKDVLFAVGIVVATIVLPALWGIVVAAAPVIAIFAGLVAGVAVLRNAWERDWGGIQTKTIAVANAVKDAISTGNMQPVFDVLQGIGAEIATAATDWATSFVGWAADLWGDASFYFDIYKNKLVSWITFQKALIGLRMERWKSSFIDWAGDIWTDLSTNLETMVAYVWSWIDAKKDVAYTHLYGWVTEFSGWATEVWANLRPNLELLGVSMMAWIESKSPKLAGSVAKWGAAFDELKITLTNVWNTVKPIVVNNLNRIQTALQEAQKDVAPLGEAFSNLWTSVKPVLTALGLALVVGIGAALNLVLIIAESVLPEIGNILTAVVDNMTATVELLKSVFVDGFGIISSLIQGDWAGAWDSAKSLFESFKNFVTTNFSGLMVLLTSITAIIRNVVVAIFDDMGINIVSKIREMVSGVRLKFLEMQINLTTKATAIKTSIAITFQLLKTSITGAIEDAKAAIVGTFNTLKDEAAAAVDGLKQSITGKFTEIKEWIEGLSISNPFSAVVGWANAAKQAAQDAWSYLGGGGGSSTSANAAGTPFFRGGLATINEMGGEALILPGRNRQAFLPRGTQIIPAEQTAQMMGGRGDIIVKIEKVIITSDMDAERFAYRTAEIIRKRNI